jgi:hypothetical protein
VETVLPLASKPNTLTEAEKAAVRAELELILASRHFNGSKRYPSFLRFVVNRALDAQSDSLKERTLGIEVFGRDPDYDTSADPIVRVTAAEIRKRIDQYYQEVGHQSELRITLPLGAYLPQFATAPKPPSPIVEKGIALPPTPAPQAEDVAVASSRKALLSASLIALVVLVAALVAAAFIWRQNEDRSFHEFWRPFTTSSDAVLFCVADQSQFSTITLRDAANPSRQITNSDTMVTVIIDDVIPLVNIAGVLQSKGQSYRLKSENSTTLTDLRQSPTVLIGAYDNSWTLRETANLRFHFANNPEMTQFWIEDRENPQKREWTLNREEQQKGVYKDFALIGRYVDPNTDRWVIVLAGIARGGTVAAGEFLVDPKRMNDLMKSSPKDWARRNMEVVLETQVIDGRSGPPRLVASNFW